MTNDQRDRMITFLRVTMCSPCRSGDLEPDHARCSEAAALIAVLEGEEPTSS